jgi:hypothetical protein
MGRLAIVMVVLVATAVGWRLAMAVAIVAMVVAAEGGGWRRWWWW